MLIQLITTMAVLAVPAMQVLMSVTAIVALHSLITHQEEFYEQWRMTPVGTPQDRRAMPVAYFTMSVIWSAVRIVVNLIFDWAWGLLTSLGCWMLDNLFGWLGAFGFKMPDGCARRGYKAADPINFEDMISDALDSINPMKSGPVKDVTSAASSVVDDVGDFFGL